MRRTLKIRVLNDNDLSRAIIEVGRISATLAFDPSAAMKINTAVSELARNLIKYAGGGSISAREIQEGQKLGLEIVVTDRGPGIEDLDSALSDNFSTGGTLGLGLPGVRRKMDEFEIKTEVGKGTRVKIRHWIG